MATIQYLAPCSGMPKFYGRQRERDNLPLESRVVEIANARLAAEAPTLDRHGFALVAHRSAALERGLAAAWRADYLRDIEALVAELTGARSVVALANGVVRRSERAARFGRDGTTVPGRFAHCDFSPSAAGSQYWVEKMLGREEGRRRLARRFAIYNVWRVLSDPPQDTPLAVCDARSVAAQDVARCACVDDPLDGPEHTIENSVFRFNPAHRWSYFPGMTPHEALVFRGYDSDARCAGGVPHAAFDDPSCGSEAQPRESIDERVIAFF